MNAALVPGPRLTKGRLLYREPFLSSESRLYAPFLWGTLFALAWIAREFPTASLVFLLLGTVFLGATLLFLPGRARVHEHGVVLSVRLWDRVVGGKATWMRKEQILRLWPLLRVQPVGGTKQILGYELVTEAARGRIYAGRGTYVEEGPSQRLTQALERMSGGRWSAVFQPLPDLGPQDLERIQFLLGQSHRAAFRRFTRELFATLTAAIGILIVGLFAIPGVDWLTSLILGLVPGAVLILLAWFRAVTVTGPAFDERLTAFSVYKEAKELERRTGERLLPDLELHPDYAEIDASVDLEEVDFKRLQSDLESALGATALLLWGMMGPVIGALSGFFLLGWPLWSGYVALGLGLVLALPGFRAMRASTQAYSKVEALIREEWRTGQRILPLNFRIPEGYNLFREPPYLSERDLKRMRSAEGLSSERLMALLGGTILGGVAAGIGMPVILGLGVLLSLLVGLLSVAATMIPALVLISRVGRGARLLKSLREYEEATGRRFLPTDLSARPSPPLDLGD